MWELKTFKMIYRFESLDDAMKQAKTFDEFVTISNGEMEFVGKFGYDEVKNGKTPDGRKYDWTMRRDETHRRSRKKLS